MGTTTFSGPVKAGGIQATTGTDVGVNVANRWFCSNGTVNDAKYHWCKST